MIDFGDLFAGDPAYDLAAAWLLLPDGAAGRFFAAYEPARTQRPCAVPAAGRC
ncbi:phosphotransferase [Nocardiopsis sp. NPDC060348]|uniref:phosphotransferase n=1 Tax=unclassified Nocardiopsis TaxID=2649073 RepID=UPI000A43DACA